MQFLCDDLSKSVLELTTFLSHMQMNIILVNFEFKQDNRPSVKFQISVDRIQSFMFIINFRIKWGLTLSCDDCKLQTVPSHSPEK